MFRNSNARVRPGSNLASFELNIVGTFLKGRLWMNAMRREIFLCGNELLMCMCFLV